MKSIVLITMNKYNEILKSVLSLANPYSLIRVNIFDQESRMYSSLEKCFICSHEEEHSEARSEGLNPTRRLDTKTQRRV